MDSERVDIVGSDSEIRVEEQIAIGYSMLFYFVW